MRRLACIIALLFLACGEASSPPVMLAEDAGFDADADEPVVLDSGVRDADPLPDVIVFEDAGRPDVQVRDAAPAADATSVPDAMPAADAAVLPLVPFSPSPELAVEFEPGLTVGEVVLRFAPVIYHDTGEGGPDGLGAKQDYLMAADYDGDRRHDNNWDNLGAWALRAHLYYGFVATSSHYFLSFAEYHARDWAQSCSGLFTECHEGDMESVRVVVARGSSTTPDRLVLMYTAAHGRGYAWSDDPAMGDIEGALDCEDDAGSIGPCDGARTHARLYIQEEGHGPIACRAAESPPFLGYFGFGGGVRCTGASYETTFENGTGIVFRGSLGEGEIFAPELATMNAIVPVSLTPAFDTLFAWRYEVGSGQLWRSDSAFAYSGTRGVAPFAFAQEIGGRFDPMQFVNDASSGSAPWNDRHFGNSGDIFFDPAFVLSARYQFDPPIALEYTYNPYVY